ncbi:HEPN domain-containing protein [Streptomyces microflavus]|uniref:HEPN domain-containing protein n=1 Tax=Streptomyces microflavus TaxID=1919 RepID=UPI0036B0E8B2
MPSVARANFRRAVDRAVLLRRACCQQRRGRRLSDDVRQVHYHSHLAACVAAWEAYVESIVLEFLDRSSRPLDPAFSELRHLLRGCAISANKKFNTPNWDNSRNHIIRYTGFDPITSWSTARSGSTSISSKTFLNDILLVRHSFAHGFPLPPTVPWLIIDGSQRLLNVQNLKEVEAFLKSLTATTDTGLSARLSSVFAVNVNW